MANIEAVTKKEYTSTSSQTEYNDHGIQFLNNEDIEVWITDSASDYGAGLPVLQQTAASAGDALTSSHPQVAGTRRPALTTSAKQRGYTISSDGTDITLKAAPTTGSTVTIQRVTRDGSGKYTTFSSGSTIRHTDLNQAFDEVRYQVQEARNGVMGQGAGQAAGDNIDAKSLINKIEVGRLPGPVTDGKVINFPDADGTVMLNNLRQDAIIIGTSEGIINKADVGGDLTASYNSTNDKAEFTVVNVGDVPMGTMTVGAGKTIKFEGTTANDHEITLTPADPTADRTITFPDADGTVMLNNLRQDAIIIGTSEGIINKADVGGDLTASYNASTDKAEFTVTNVDGANITNDIEVKAGKNIKFEGTTSNDHETSLVAADPTGDRTITFPDASGHVMLNNLRQNAIIIGTSEGIINKADVGGDLTVSYNSTTDEAEFTVTNIGNAEINLGVNKNITFEGATANDFETTLTVTDPTADRTITFPNADGTVMLNNLRENAVFIGTSEGIINKADVGGDLTAAYNSTTDEAEFTVTNIDSANVHIAAGKTFTFEGTTANDYELTLQADNPTADRTITFPDNDGHVMLNNLRENGIFIGDSTGKKNSADVGGDLTAAYNSSTDKAEFTIANSVIKADLINAGGSTADDKVLVYDSNEATKWKWATQTGTGGGGGELDNVSDDTTPQLGGDLDVNGKDIITVSNADIELAPNGTGATVLKGNTNSGTLKFNCENNSHAVTLKGPAHSAAATYTLTLPTSAGSADQVLTTDGSGVLSWATGGTDKLPLAGGTLTGDVTLNAQSDVRFADADSSNYVALQAPATVASNVTWTLPAADGTASQRLVTNGSGALAWETSSATIVADGGNFTSGSSLVSTSTTYDGGSFD